MTLLSEGWDRLEIPENQFQAAVFRMVVVADSERDIDGVACQKRRLLDAFGHVPAKGVESDFEFRF